MPLYRNILQALPTALPQRSAAAMRRGATYLSGLLLTDLRRHLAAWREADDLDRSAVSAQIKARALAGAYGERIRRRAASERERGMPQRLREDVRQALALPDATARRTAVDEIVEAITDGTYGTTFQRRAVEAAPDAHPHDPG